MEMKVAEMRARLRNSFYFILSWKHRTLLKKHNLFGYKTLYSGTLLIFSKHLADQMHHLDHNQTPQQQQR